MSKQTVQGLILEELKELNYKMDKLYAEIIPEIKIEATKTATKYSMIGGGITLVISLAGLAVAYYK